MRWIIGIIFFFISLGFPQTPIFEILATNYDGTDVANTGSLGSVRDGHEEGTVVVSTSPTHFSFDGDTSNHIRSNTTEATPSLLITTGTLEAYIQVDDLSANGIFFGIADTGTTLWYFQFQTNSDDLILVNLRRNAQQYTIKSPASSIVIDTWYHVVWQIDNTLSNPMRMYIDGVSQTLTKTITTDTTDITDMSAGINARMKWAIGGLIDSTPLSFVGDVTFVRLYDSYLTPSQVATLYANRLGVGYENRFKRFKDFNKFKRY